jgi:mannose-6-phosphate isomerase-like protein (cupin superfamily)
MIHRNYKQGQKLDVAGLNQITVLLDRSETELTEIGINEWKLDGPPHKHNDKDQIFYIISGDGVIKLGSDEYKVRPGFLIYVPAGLVHQSITKGSEPLCYVLYNIFNDSQKEGHSTFAEHIEKVKQIRKQQAETGNAEVDESGTIQNILRYKVISDVFSGEKDQSGLQEIFLHLSSSNTNRCELSVVRCQQKYAGDMHTHLDREITIFIVDGEGYITIDNEREKMKSGDLVFVPRGVSHRIETTEFPLEYLSQSSLITV